MENQNIEPVETTDAQARAVFAYVINDLEIVDPTISECGRFTVKPDYYGLTSEQVERLALLNNVMGG
jgi:hypothetical protein